jgi:hypothetical protein
MTNKPRKYVVGVAEETKAYMQAYDASIEEPGMFFDAACYNDSYIDALHQEMIPHFEYLDTAIASFDTHLAELRDNGQPSEVKLEASLRQYARSIFDQLVEYGLYDSQGQLTVKHDTTLNCSIMILHSRSLS